MKNPHLTSTDGKNKKIDFTFNAGKLSSDAGTIFIQQIDGTLQLTNRLSNFFIDPRNQDFIAHQQRDLIAQRIYAIVQGYEDLNDHQELRSDPALVMSVKNTTDADAVMTSPPTLSRLENRVTDELDFCQKKGPLQTR